jgi:DNA-binding GntR family transcriptional regulator
MSDSGDAMSKAATQSISSHGRAGRGSFTDRSVSSLLDRAYNEIKFRIITCRYRPGEVLSEAGISMELKIGRTPIHQAIHRLMMDGLVSVMPRKGVMVRPISIDEVMEIIGVRLVTECYCARLAADRIDDSELQQLQAIVDALEKVVEQRTVEKMMLLDREFHDTLARAAKNAVLADVLRNLHDRSLRFWFISLRDLDHHRNVLEQHRAIVKALQSRQPDTAEAAMRDHILAFQRNVTRQV